MRLIDADKLKRKAQKESTVAWKMKIKANVETILNQFIDWIDNAPTIEPERKKGKWLDGHRRGYGGSLYWFIYCSECLCERDDDDHDKDTPFCPNCGADMRTIGEESG